MAPLKLAVLAFAAFHSLFAVADQGEAIIESIEELADDGTTPAGAPVKGLLNVLATASFLDSDVFGVKLVNGHANTASFHVINNENDPITLKVVGGALWALDHEADVMNMGSAVRNLTSSVYNFQIPANNNATLDYKFSTELHPQDLKLILAAIVESKEGQQFQIDAFNATVSIVDAPISFFDPQMLFLYAFLATLLAGTVYFIYNTFLKTFFPQQKKGRTQRKAPVPASTETLFDSATTSGAKTFDPSWIQAQHLQRPEAKRVRSGTPKTRAK